MEGPEETQRSLDSVSGVNSVRLRVDERSLSMSSDLVQALVVASDAQRYRVDTAKGGVAHSITRTTALVGVMVVNDQVQELGREAGIDWELFIEGAGLQSWRPPTAFSDPDAEDDVAFHPLALQAIDRYSDRFGRERPVIDSLGLCWGLVGEEGEGRFEERLLKAGADVKGFQSLLWEAIASELESSSVPEGESIEPREASSHSKEGGAAQSVGQDLVPEDEPYDRVRTLTDAPAVVDLLNRKPLAESLATRIRATRSDDPATSFLLHVDGPWGAGKSTLLNFLRDELESDSLVVYFNAWREQRAGPPWWGLLRSLRRAAIQDGGWKFRLRESAARLRGLGLRFWIVAAIAVIITVAVFAWATSDASDLTALGSTAASIATILALGGTIWAITARLGRSRAPGSLSAAAKYVENQDDPMQAVSDQFNEIVRLVGRWVVERDGKRKVRFVVMPVVIFVDDLDRCSTAYVVEFLEAVQTIIRDDPRSLGQSGASDDGSDRVRKAPYFVVAADGRWIRRSYEKEYSDFAEVVSYPGRPLGYLFLDKAFQLTTTLPAIDKDLRRSYWEILLGTRTSGYATTTLEAAERVAKEALKGATTDAEVLDRVEAQPDDDPVVRSAFRGEAVRSMASAEVASRTEHALTEYADLLDPNPRAMKRFVNAYSVERALRTIEARRPALDQLARWTIVQLRWPRLADILRDDPAAVRFVEAEPGPLSVVDVERFTGIEDLLTDPDVVRTITDDDPRYGRPLDAEGIRESAGL